LQCASLGKAEAQQVLGEIKHASRNDIGSVIRAHALMALGLGVYVKQREDERDHDDEQDHSQ
jgi:hypothetical protein